MDNLALQCRCGQIKGRAIKTNPADGTRVICYCKDCQAFAHALKAGAEILDEQGGTDIYQLPPSRLQIQQGLEQIRCLRLSDKGLYRWYAGCCNTPIGNSLAPRVPMIGLIHSFIVDPEREAKLGPVRACVNLRGDRTNPQEPARCSARTRLCRQAHAKNPRLETQRSRATKPLAQHQG